MQFRVLSSNWCLESEADKLIRDYPCLNKYDLKIVDNDVSPLWKTPKKKAFIDIHSLEELLELQDAVKHPLIITPDQIEIYDGYRE